MKPRNFSLLSFVVVLFAFLCVMVACGGNLPENGTTISDSEDNEIETTLPPTEVPLPHDVTIFKSASLEERDTLQLVTIANCDGLTDLSDQLSQTFNETIHVELLDGPPLDTEGALNVAFIGSVQLGAHIAEEYGLEYGAMLTGTYSIPTPVAPGTITTYTLQLINRWMPGTVKINSQDRELQYDYRLLAEIELVLRNPTVGDCPINIEPTLTPTQQNATPDS